MDRRFPAAAYVLLRRENDVLLLQRTNTGYRDAWYSLPAGRLEDGEAITACAVRELREETGIEARTSDLSAPLVMHRYADDGHGSCMDFFFELRTWSGVPVNVEPGKCSDLRFFSIRALPEKTIPYIYRAIELFEDGNRFAEFGWDQLGGVT